MTVRYRPEPCPRCRKNRWRTVAKRLAWRCRWCGHVRDARPAHAQEPADA